MEEGHLEGCEPCEALTTALVRGGGGGECSGSAGYCSHHLPLSTSSPYIPSRPLPCPAAPQPASATSIMLVEVPQSSPCGRQPSGLKPPPDSTFPTLLSPCQLRSSARRPNCRSGTLSWALPPISVRLPWASSPIHASGLSLVSDDATFLSPDPGFPQPLDASP